MILVEKFVENSDENSNESFVNFCFDLAVESCCDNADQNFHNAAELYFFLL